MPENYFDWKDKKVLVTGAGGFIGSHLTEALIKKEAKVCCFLRYNSLSRKGFLETLSPAKQSKLSLIKGDLEAQETVMQAAKGMDVIFHLAALISIPYSFLHPEETMRTNAIGTLNILMAAREYGIAKTVIMSTSEVYGTARYVPIDEEHPLQAQSPYSASKIAAEKLAESFYRAYGLPVVIARPFNTYGPRQSVRAVIPTIISQALGRGELKLGDISTKRDFTFVKDTVRGLMLMAEKKGSDGQAINLGSNYEITIQDIIKLVSRLLNKRLKIITDSQRLRPGTSEVKRLWASNEKAERLLGWRPKIKLEEGISKTITWIRDNLSLFEIDKYGV